MSLTDLTGLAQVDPEQIEVTAAQGVVAALRLGMLTVSLVMIVIWGVRFFQRAHFLPAADRGILRSPPTLTAVAVALTSLMGILGVLGSVPAGPEDGDRQPAADRGEFAEADSESADSESADSNPGDAAPEGEGNDEQSALALESDNEAMSLQAKFRRGIEATLILDVILLAGFGIVIWRYRAWGAVRIPESASFAGRRAASSPPRLPAAAGEMLWPDLNEPRDPATSIAQHSGAETDLVTAREATPSDMFAEGTQPVPAARWEESADPGAGEPVSVTTELWYAFEVFAVSLVPTMILRVIIVLLYASWTGSEVIPQHPFLELMRDGIDLPMLLTIAFMAIVMAPIMEELLYRVVILGGLARFGWVTSGLWISSILFGLAHGFPDCVALLPLALLLGYTYLRRRSYITVMLVHLLFNVFNLFVAALGML